MHEECRGRVREIMPRVLRSQSEGVMRCPTSQPYPARIWSLVGIDIIGPLQERSQGNKYIVAITDHFSKWTEAAAFPKKTAARVADFLYTTVCRLGCIDTLISDQ